MPSSATDVYRAARDSLLALHGDHAKAVAEFRGPQFDGPFNWAIDWFDAYARGNEGTALHVVEEDGRSARYSFDTWSAAPTRWRTGCAGTASRRATTSSSCSATRSSCGRRCSPSSSWAR